jgi:membrane fusion protein, multidrug efflux system
MAARKHTVILLIGLALVVLLLLARCFRQASSTTAAAPAARDTAPRVVPVYTHRVLPQLLREQVTATGTLRAGESIDVVSEITGKVMALEFAEGAAVEAGDLLVKLDDSELRAQYERARHRVALARLEAERQQELFAAQSASQQALDAAVNEVRVLEAETNLIRAQLEKTELRAPFAGVIGLRYVSIGSLVTPSTRIASLQNLDELKIDFAIAERHMAHARSGASIMVNLVGREEPLRGEVYAVEPQIDANTRTIQLRARAENPGDVFPGAFATIDLTLREVPDALLVPATALVPGLNEQRVFVVVEGRAESRLVRTGIRRPREVQLLEGIEPGAEVITSGQAQLQPGAAVRPVAREGQSASSLAAHR